MDSNDKISYSTASENRRNQKRDFERGLISNEPDKFQLNDIMLIAMVVIAAVLSLTDFTFSFGDWKKLTALTIFLYMITMLIYRNRYAKGISRGKKDEEYLYSLDTYREKRETITSRGLIGHVAGFCSWYKKKELREYRESLLSDVEIEYDEYKEKYIKMPEKEILRLPLSGEAKQTIIRCNRLKAVKLTPGMILNESGEFDRNKLIGKSGRQREREDKRIQAISRAVYVVFGAAIAFDMIFHFSLETVAQWVARMLPIVMALVNGDDNGYCNVTVTETNFKKDQANVIDIFLEYADTNGLGKQDEALAAEKE